MISAQLQGAEQAVIFLSGTSDKLNVAFQRAFSRIAIALQRYIVTQKLSGQVLHHRTGTLARSVIQRVEQNGTQIVAIVQAGGLAPYAGVHEYGGSFTIPEHMSASRLGTKFIVHEHTAHFPERSFMRTSLQENMEFFVSEVNKAVAEALAT